MAVRQMSGICPAVMLKFNKCVTTDANSTEQFLKSHDGSPSQPEDVRLTRRSIDSIWHSLISTSHFAADE